MTINNSSLTPNSAFHLRSLQHYTDIHKIIASTSISYRHRCCSTHSTCLTMSAKLIWVRRWVWDEFISAGWESSAHMLGMLGNWEPYPYFPWGASRCNPDRSMETLNGVEIGQSYLYKVLRECTHIHTDTYTPTRTHQQSYKEVHILNVTYFSSCYLVLWSLLILCLWGSRVSGENYSAAFVALNLNQYRA